MTQIMLPTVIFKNYQRNNLIKFLKSLSSDGKLQPHSKFVDPKETSFILVCWKVF